MVSVRSFVVAAALSAAVLLSSSTASAATSSGQGSSSCALVTGALTGALSDLQEYGSSAELSEAVTLSALAASEMCAADNKDAKSCQEARANLRKIEELLRRQQEILEKLESEIAQGKVRIESITSEIDALRAELTGMPAQIQAAAQQGNRILVEFFQRRYVAGLAKLNALIAERTRIEGEVPVKEASLDAPRRAVARLEGERNEARSEVRQACSPR